LTPRGKPLAIAIAPAMTFVKTDVEDVELTTLDTIVRSRGGELPLLISYRFSARSVFYGGLRYSFDRVRIISKSEPEQKHTLHRLGLMTGQGFNADPIYLRLEAGFEAAKQVNGGFKTIPIFSLGLGFDF
jgi:hypothetical protein